MQLYAEGPTAQQPRCFAISVRLNGQPIDGPQSVTLKTRKAESNVALDNKCFSLPSAMAESELIDVSFTLPGNQIHMSDVPTDFLHGSWDVDLADKKFGKDVIVPKHASASEVCAVVFLGEVPPQSLAQAQCRTPAVK
jgi:hypothetical protein